MPSPIKVLYEDEAIIVFDKPAGILTIPSPQKENHTLVDLVNAQHAQAQGRLHPCHRLDRDTSGAILFAKGKSNQQKMMDLFHRQEVKKKYLAFVRGLPHPLQGEIRIPIADFHQKRFAPHQAAKSALTRYQVLERYDLFSVVSAEPVTGRTNQIRIHFAKIGHPLLGERVYAFGRDFKIKFRRVALHSHELSWPHPVTRKVVHIVCELPQDMTEFLRKN